MHAISELRKRSEKGKCFPHYDKRRKRYVNLVGDNTVYFQHYDWSSSSSPDDDDCSIGHQGDSLHDLPNNTLVRFSV